jgi:hypothetical protein
MPEVNQAWHPPSAAGFGPESHLNGDTRPFFAVLQSENV